MTHATILRALIVVELASALLGIYADIALQSSLPAPLHAYLTAQSQGPLTIGGALTFAILVPMFAALVVAWVGLWLLKRWARTLYTALIVVFLVVTLFLGPVVASALAAMLYTVSSIAAGVILGLVWLSELRGRFEVRA
jgi:hypothetical protein